VKRHDEEFKKRGAQIVVVSFMPLESLKAYQEIHHWPYLLLSDPDRKFYRLLRLQKGTAFQIFHPKTLLSYTRYVIQGKKIEKTKEDIYQLGGDFIFDRKGIYRFGYPSQRPDDRPPVSLLIQKVSKISTV